MVEVLLVGLIAGGRSGVPRYAATLARALDRVAPEYPGVAMTLLTTPRGAGLTEMRNVPVQLVGWPFAGANAGMSRIVGEQLASRSRPSDLLHFFDLTGPVLAPRRRFVTTIHDATVHHVRDQEARRVRTYVDNGDDHARECAGFGRNPTCRAVLTPVT